MHTVKRWCYPQAVSRGLHLLRSEASLCILRKPLTSRALLEAMAPAGCPHGHSADMHAGPASGFCRLQQMEAPGSDAAPHALVLNLCKSISYRRQPTYSWKPRCSSQPHHAARSASLQVICTHACFKRGRGAGDERPAARQPRAAKPRLPPRGLRPRRPARHVCGKRQRRFRAASAAVDRKLHEASRRPIPRERVARQPSPRGGQRDVAWGRAR